MLSCSSQGQAPSGTHTHTVIVLQFHFVQVQYIYVHVLRIHCGGCDRTVLYTALFCVVWVPPLPYLTHLGFILGYSILTSNQ